MKFSLAALVGFFAVAQAAVRNDQRNLGPGDSSGSSSGTSTSSSDFCENCGFELPGYVFFGDQYLEEDFYLKAFGGLTSESSSSDELVIDNLGLCVDDRPGVGPPPGFIIPTVPCIFVTIISEIIFQSDLLSCLLISFDKTTKDTLCLIADVVGVPNPDVLGTPSRKLTEGGSFTSPMVEFFKGALAGDAEGRKLNEASVGTCAAEMGPSAFPLCMLGVGEAEVMKFCEDGGFGPLCAEGKLGLEGRRRQLNTAIRPENDEFGSGGLIQLIANVIDAVGFSEQFFQVQNNRLARGFFLKCIRDLPPFACLLIYTLEKTIDAIICQKLQDCDIDEVCDSNQNFLTEYNSRKLARDIPTFFDPLTDGADGAFNFLVADIIAPCLACEDQCADLCWYVDNFDQCDSYKRAFIFLAVDGTDINLTEFRYIAVPLGWLVIFATSGFDLLPLLP